MIDFDLIEKMKQNEKPENPEKHKIDKNLEESSNLSLEDAVDEIQKKLDEIIINDKNSQNDDKLHFTDIPKNKIYEGLKHDQLTKLNFDKSQILYDLKNINQNLIGEFQIAFIQFQLLESLTSFEQWKKLVILICNCEQAVKNDP